MVDRLTLTVKQEGFAREFVICGCASKAYRHAYNTERMKQKTVHETACKLLATPKVATRVSELQAQAQKRNDISFDRMLEMFIEDRELARQNNQTAAAISADNSIAKMLGYMVDRSESKIHQTIDHQLEIADQATAKVADLLNSIISEKAAQAQLPGPGMMTDHADIVH